MEIVILELKFGSVKKKKKMYELASNLSPGIIAENIVPSIPWIYILHGAITILFGFTASSSLELDIGV